MTGPFLSAWLLFPLLMLAACGGLGLLVRRASGGAVSGVLLLPVGFALAVSLSAIGTSVTWLAPKTGWIILAIAICGFGLQRGSLRPSRWRLAPATPFAAAAALAAFVAYGGPVFLTGTPSWTGYARIVDTAFQMGFAQHLAEVGRQVPAAVNSSFEEVMQGLTANGYPGGAQATLGVFSHVIRSEVAWCYQSYQAWSAAMGALAVFALLRRVLSSRLLCAVGGAVAIQANILYDYALEGGIKELTAASLILLVGAVLVEWLASERRSVRSGLPLATPLAAVAATFSYGAVPWVGLITIAGFVLSMLSRRRLRTLAGWGLTAAAAALLAIPTVISAIKQFGTAKEAVNGVVEVGLGNLTAPIPEISVLGVWISNDYRFPVFAKQGVSHAFDVGVIVLIAVGVLCALWRRRWMLAAFGIAVPLAFAYVVAHSGPWVSLKAYGITATMFLTMAFVGAGWLATARARRFTPVVRTAGWLSAAALTGAVLYGNALTYHDMSLAPAARYVQLATIGKRFPDPGPTFYPAFDEYAEYFLRREHGYDLVHPPGLKIRPGVLKLAPGQFPYAYDLNQFELEFVELFHLYVLPRNPLTSRPPANFDLIDETPDFEVWRRVRPASEVLIHFPLGGSPVERTRAFCLGLQSNLRRAGPGAEVAYVPSSPRVILLPPDTRHPSYWHALGPEFLRAYGAGVITASFTVPANGTYEVAMQGSVGRPVTLYVDGRHVGGAAYQERYPGQYIHMAKVRLTAGTHSLRLTRPNGDLHPGSGDGPDASSGLLGPIVFTLQLPGSGRLQIAPASRAPGICRARAGYQWMEVLRPVATAAP